MNTIKKHPEVGDIAIRTAEGIRFAGQDATKEWVDKQQAIGVVYYANGNHVKVVAGSESNEPWSRVVDYELVTIPGETGDYAVKLRDKDKGSFHYEKKTGEKAEFVSQLDEWLKTNAPEYEAYMRGERAIFQLTDYTSWEGDNIIAGCTMKKLVGKEIEHLIQTSALTQTGQVAAYGGMCRTRIEDEFKNNTNASCNPKSRMDGVKKIFETFPCSKAYYDGELGDGLRANFETYQTYLDACMLRPWELGRGMMTERDGQTICKMLNPKKVLVRGVETPAYPAANNACNYDSGVAGFGKGAWWLPSMHELCLLMRDIRFDNSDKINTSLLKKTGWITINYYVSRWSCCQFYAHHSWYYFRSGISTYASFCNRFAVRAVSAFSLDF